MALPIITAQEEQSPITATLVSSSMDLTTVIDAYAPVPMWPKIELYSRLPSAHMLSLSMAGMLTCAKLRIKPPVMPTRPLGPVRSSVFFAMPAP